MRVHWLVLAACLGLGACVPPPPYYGGYGYGYRHTYGGYPYGYAAPGYSYGYVPAYP